MYEISNFMGKKVLKSSLLRGDENFVSAFFTTRDLPLKFGERNDLKAKIEENKALIAKGFKISIENVIIPIQTHSDNIEVISRESAEGALKKQSFPNCDGLITKEQGIAIGLNFADCVPLIFYDKKNHIIASSHAGWRGTVAKIGVQTVDLMMKEFDSKSKDIIVLIGPAIDKCCYEVGEDVKNKLLQTIDEKEHKLVCDKMNIDLKKINELQLRGIGVEKIDTCDYCTSCRSDLFYSYRKE